MYSWELGVKNIKSTKINFEILIKKPFQRTPTDKIVRGVNVDCCMVA